MSRPTRDDDLEGYGPPIPLSEEALAEQARHAGVIAEINEGVDWLNEEGNGLRERARELNRMAAREMERWAATLHRLHPELNDAEEFVVLDEGRTIRLKMKPAGPKMEPWVVELIKKIEREA